LAGEASRKYAKGKRMLLVIDNYDSYTYNLVQYLGELASLGLRCALFAMMN
jgi:anthranilate/para-aminobenzoate synthase component II